MKLSPHPETLVIFDKVSFGYAVKKILIEANFALSKQERVFFVGRNGSGKSTIFKLINSEIVPDSGDIHFSPKIKISYLNQALSYRQDVSIRNYILSAFNDSLALLQNYEKLISSPLKSKSYISEVGSLEDLIKKNDLWSIGSKVDSIITQLDLKPNQLLSHLSGGLSRRASLAKAIVTAPDLLLLDEPTNHLDLESIKWLEKYIGRLKCAIACISHDRTFIDGLADRIVDIDRGKIKSWSGNYSNYIPKKIETNRIEDHSDRLFNKKLELEEIWIRKGVKAREKRNEGRVRNLEELRNIKASKVKRLREPRIPINRSIIVPGKRMFLLTNVNYSIDEHKVLSNIKFLIHKHERIGLIGPNGCGKSTLLGVLAGLKTIDSGNLKIGTNIEIAYYNQESEVEDLSISLKDYVSDKKDYIDINGKRKHIIGYLKEFLFEPSECLSPLSVLSGGQRNRAKLAKTFTKSSNLLILDEPTNDLDIESLEALEGAINKYRGTLLVVSHDRYFLDKVINRVFAFDDKRKLVTNFYGNYTSWINQANDYIETSNSPDKQEPENSSHKIKPKLSYIAQRNLDKLLINIEKKEIKVSELIKFIGSKEFSSLDHHEMHAITLSHEATQNELDMLYKKWEELAN